MSDIRVGKSNDVLFVLKSEISTSLELSKEPVGWKEDELEITRHKQYHGIFTQFTNALVFYNEAKEYILNNYTIKGLNGVLYLIKYELKNVGDDVKYVQTYIGIADYNTMSIKNNGLSIKFNSNDLAELIKSHETDEFELERTDTIDGGNIDALKKYNAYIKGRALTAAGESDSYDIQINNGWEIAGRRIGTVRTEIIAQGPGRHSSVDVEAWPGSTSAELPSSMFFVDTVAAGEVIDLNIKFDFRYKSENLVPELYSGNNVDVILRRHEWDGATNYFLVDEQILFTSVNDGWHEFQAEVNFLDFPYNQGLTVVFRKQIDNNGMWIDSERHNIKVNTIERHEPSIDLKFIFFHDCFSRLLNIISGYDNRFYSKVFGREEDGYAETGEYGLIGIMSGLWARGWKPGSELYKSIKMSLKDAFDSAKAVFNIGVSIETINFTQRVRIEKLEHFYRDTVVVKLPEQVYDVEENVDKDLFFSGIELGYRYGGEYENEIGLDEPNTKTSWVTPLRKTKNKYTRTSVIRSDEYGLEKQRRKQQEFYPTEDTQQDEHNWFLDLKKTEGPNYEQNDWSDRLQKEPTGVLSPGTYRSFLLTPLRMLFRHGWILRAGLEQSINLGKKIKYISSKANTSLSTLFIGETIEYKENEDIIVRNLNRSRILPNKIKCKHPITSELMDLINGTTRVFIGGEYEEVPNYYFKFEWIHDDGSIKRGYLLNLKPKESGEFEFQEANETLIQ